MLQHSFRESQQSEITLDCKLAPFQAMLEYLYTDSIFIILFYLFLFIFVVFTCK